MIVQVLYRDGTVDVFRGVLPTLSVRDGQYHAVTKRGDNHWWPIEVVRRVDFFDDEGMSLRSHPFMATYDGGANVDGHCNLCMLDEHHPAHDRPKGTEP